MTSISQETAIGLVGKEVGFRPPLSIDSEKETIGAIVKRQYPATGLVIFMARMLPSNQLVPLESCYFESTVCRASGGEAMDLPKSTHIEFSGDIKDALLDIADHLDKVQKSTEHIVPPTTDKREPGIGCVQNHTWIYQLMGCAHELRRIAASIDHSSL